VVFTPLVPLEPAAVAILHVPDAAQEVVRWFYEHSKIKRARVSPDQHGYAHARSAAYPGPSIRTKMLHATASIHRWNVAGLGLLTTAWSRAVSITTFQIPSSPTAIYVGMAIPWRMRRTSASRNYVDRP
jgi:hypothetical protein